MAGKQAVKEAYKQLAMCGIAPLDAKNASQAERDVSTKCCLA